MADKKQHLPMYEVGPVYGAVIIAVTGNNPKAQNHIFHDSFNRHVGIACNIYRCMVFYFNCKVIWRGLL